MSKKVSDIKVLRITAFTIAIMVSIFLLVSTILSCVAKENGWVIFYNAAFFCLAGVAIAYGAWGYRIPNTRMLKYSIMVFAVLVGVETLFLIGNQNIPKDAAFMAQASFSFILVGLVIYMSGRMDRILENRIIIPSVLGLLIINYVIFLCCNPVYASGTDLAKTAAILNGLGMIFVWITFALMYYIRFRSYKIEPEEE